MALLLLGMSASFGGWGFAGLFPVINLSPGNPGSVSWAVDRSLRNLSVAVEGSHADCS